MDSEVAQKLANLKMFCQILESKGEDAAVKYVEMITGEDIPHEKEAKEKPHLTAVK
jgi:hypothetical protein